jgi:hypothetical protein
MKLTKIISLIAILFLLVPYLSFAQISPPESYEPPNIPTQFFGCDPNEPLRKCMLKILDKILKVILVIALAFAAIMIAWAGVLYIMKGGEKEEEIKKIKGRLIYAAVGLVVAFLAWVITVILSQTIGRGVEI